MITRVKKNHHREQRIVIAVNIIKKLFEYGRTYCSLQKGTSRVILIRIIFSTNEDISNLVVIIIFIGSNW
jgi:hypothetical protein